MKMYFSLTDITTYNQGGDFETDILEFTIHLHRSLNPNS